MSDECDNCGEHCLIREYDLLELIFWARRYCDGRSTYAPGLFNDIYQRIRSQYPDLLRCKDQFDNTLMNKGEFWPYAQDGMYKKEIGHYDVVPRSDGERKRGL